MAHRDDGTTIRTATAADLGALRRVYRAASLGNPGDRAALLAHPEHLDFAGEHVASGHTRVAEGPGGIAGFATVVPRGPRVHELEDLFVTPERQRQGIGAALVRDAVARAREARGTRIEVLANDHARAFYEACGFTAGARVETLLGEGLRMVLALDPGGEAQAT